MLRPGLGFVLVVFLFMLESVAILVTGTLIESRESSAGWLNFALTTGAIMLATLSILVAYKQIQRERRRRKELEAQTWQRTAALVSANRRLHQELNRCREIESSEARFRAVSEDALVGIYIIQNEKLRYVNPVLAQIFGYDSDELIDRFNPLDLIHPNDRPGVAARIQQRLSGQQAETNHVFRGLMKDGRILHCESLARPAEFQGQPAVIGTLIDTTKCKQAEIEIAQRNRELKALLDISWQLVSHPDLDERLALIAQAIVDTLPAAEAASLWLYDEKQDKLAVRAWAGYDETIAGLVTPLNESLTTLVYCTGQARIVNNMGDKQGLADNARSVIGVPLLVEGQLLGIMLADNLSYPQKFHDNDLRLLQSLAGQAAIAIKNAQLLKTITQHRQELQRLSAQLIDIRETERKRISQELHDVMGQSLTAVSINLAAIRQQLSPNCSPGLAARLSESETLTAQTLTQMRELSLELRPTMLDDLGLLPTLRWYVHRFGQRLGIEVKCEVVGFKKRLPGHLETVLYRIVQEALTNVARHAQASRVEVGMVCSEETLTILIEDNGCGFDVAQMTGLDATTVGMGLLGIRERIMPLHGHFQVDSQPGAGTRLTITIPYPLTCVPSQQ